MAKVKLEMVRAFWPEEDKRVNEGEQLEVEMEQALFLIENGIAKRVEAKPEKKKADASSE